MERIKKFIESVREPFFRYVPYSLVWIYLIIIAVFYALLTAYFPTQNGDNIEHIHSSFLVASGQVPYRDFFQHHNPLLWYLFAPFTKLFAYNSTISEVACLISLLFFLKSLVYVYQIISEFLADKLWGVLGAVMIATPGSKINAIDLRPDNYMIFCLVGGIYYYFSYLKGQKRGHLIIAFAYFFISFLFAQKALFPLFILGLSGLYFWFKHEIKTKDMLYALIFPAIGCAAFLGYLYHYDMVSLYFLCNYTFNLNLADGFEFFKIVPMTINALALSIIGWLGCLYFCWRPNRYYAVLVLLFISEFLQRHFYFSPYTYYYWLLIYLGVLCAMPFCYALNNENRFISLLFLAGFVYGGIHVGNICYGLVKDRMNKPYLPDYVTRKISPCDYVFNGDGWMFNIFGKDPAYYWQLIGQLDVIGEKTGIKAKPDINSLILELKPKFVFGANYFNKFANESGRKEIVHYIDKNIIDQYYDPTEFLPVYQLKKEFEQERRCVQGDDGKWHFI